MSASTSVFTSAGRERIMPVPGHDGVPMHYDDAKIDEAVLAVLYLTAWEEHGTRRAWKGVDWQATARLHARGVIDDPRSKNKSILFTDEGATLARAAAEKLFASTPSK